MSVFSRLLQQILAVLPFFVVFVSSLFHPYDPDLGWHLKYGEYFFNPPAGGGRLLRENIFSTEMPDFRWVNSSWVTDFISYITFDYFGFLGLSVLSALVITATFYFFAKAAKLDYFEKALIFPLLLYFLTPLNTVSFKGQLLSLMFTGIVLFLFKSYEDRKSKLVFLSIPLFTFWSNVHGQFLLGLAIFGLSIFLFLVKLILEKADTAKIFENIKPLIITFVLSLVAAVINPFGVNVYLEAFHHFGNPWQKYILEWLPQEELSINWWNQIAAGIVLFLGTIFLIFNGQIVSKLTYFVVAPFYFFSFLVRRYVWTTYFLAMPLLVPMISFLKPESKRWATISGTVILVVYLAVSFVVDNPIKRIENMSWQSYCRNFQLCSDDAAKFIAKNGLAKNLLTFYDWGGWLIWNYPEIKPSIDGRMHLWQDETGYSAFAYYYPFEQDIEDVDESKWDAVLMAPRKPMYSRLLELVDEGKWRLAYEDDYAGVFVRN